MGEDAREIESLVEKVFEVGRYSAELGWIIPVAWVPKQLLKLHDYIQEESCDDFFIEYYEAEEMINFRLITHQVTRSIYVKQHLDIFNECLWAYKNGHYKITIPALLVIVEGVLNSFSRNKNNIRMISLCRSKYEQAVFNDEFYMQEIWQSFLIFFKNLYSNSDFSSDEPDLLNRHWILHGRTSWKWDKVESLKLFHALFSIITLTIINE